METRLFHTRFWQDSYVLSLDINEKTLFFYLLTNPNNNLIGCYELSDDVIQFHTRLNKSELTRIKTKLENDRKIIFAGEWLFIVNHHKYQEYNSKTHVPAKARQWSLVPDFIKSKLDTLSIGYAYPMHTHKDKRQKIKDKRIKKEGESPRGEYPQDFEDFWHEYPRKVGKGAAFTAWKKIKGRNNQTLIDAVKAQRTQKQWVKDDGEFIPHAATWLNQRRWEDDVGKPTRAAPETIHCPGCDLDIEKRSWERHANTCKKIISPFAQSLSQKLRQ